MILSQEIVQSYKIKKKIGEGTFGEVFLCEGPNGPCAVKKMKKEVPQYGLPLCFLREIDLLTKLRGLEASIQLLGISFHQEDYAIFMEIMNSNLEEWSKKKDFNQRIRALPNLMRGIGSILTILHAHSMIHGDIKTNNIFVLRETFKLGDFGKARMTNSEGRYPCALRYTSPEYLGPLTPFQCEMWAFMIVLVEVIIGGEHMIYLKSPEDFYNKYKKGEREYNLRLFLYQCLGHKRFGKIPDAFWDFSERVMNGETMFLSPEKRQLEIFKANSKETSLALPQELLETLEIFNIPSSIEFPLKKILTKFLSLTSEKDLKKLCEACYLLHYNNIESLTFFKNNKALISFQLAILRILEYQIYIL